MPVIFHDTFEFKGRCFLYDISRFEQFVKEKYN
jgi:hypothetical protein